MSPRALTLSFGILAALLLVTAVLDFGPWFGIGDNANAVVTLLAGVAFIVLHGRLAWGWRHILAFVGITVAVSFTSEAIGVATGWVFGRYYYTDNLGPKILGVPPMIQAGYVAMSYASLQVARIILGRLGSPRGWGFLSLAFCGALIMVAWDVAMDPYQSTVGGDWIWQDGGPYFGIPLHNYVGWFGTVFAFMLLYLGFETRCPLPAPAVPHSRRAFWAAPVVYYALIGLGIVDVPLLYATMHVGSPQNLSTSVPDLERSLTLVACFVMGIPAALALVRLYQDPPPSSAPSQSQWQS